MPMFEFCAKGQYPQDIYALDVGILDIEILFARSYVHPYIWLSLSGITIMKNKDLS